MLGAASVMRVASFSLKSRAVNPTALNRPGSPKGDWSGAKDRAHALTVATAMDARVFAEFDINVDERLDFEEFLAMQPSAVRANFSADEIRIWFNQIDESGDGYVDINEWFKHSLRTATLAEGSQALIATFEKYDTDKTGALDGFEVRAWRLF